MRECRGGHELRKASQGSPMGFESAHTLQIKAFEGIRWSEFGNTGLAAVVGTCVNQNRGLEHNFKNLKYS